MVCRPRPTGEVPGGVHVLPSVTPPWGSAQRLMLGGAVGVDADLPVDPVDLLGDDPREGDHGVRFPVAAQVVVGAEHNVPCSVCPAWAQADVLESLLGDRCDHGMPGLVGSYGVPLVLEGENLSTRPLAHWMSTATAVRPSTSAAANSSPATRPRSGSGARHAATANRAIGSSHTPAHHTTTATAASRA